MRRLVYEFRGYVSGEVLAPLLVVRSRLSFYGEVDKTTGKLADGRSLKGRILVILGTRGSTVAPYILMGLARRGLAPKAIVAAEVEPMLVTASVLANVPLAAGLGQHQLGGLDDSCWAYLRVRPPHARMVCICP